MRMLKNKFIVNFKYSYLVITAMFSLSACSGGNSSSTSHTSLYYGTSNGLIYNNNSIAFSGTNALSPDGSQINAMVSESGIMYFATNDAVYIESNNLWELVSGVPPIISGGITSMAASENTIYVGGNDQYGNG